MSKLILFWSLYKGTKCAYVTCIVCFYGCSPGFKPYCIAIRNAKTYNSNDKRIGVLTVLNHVSHLKGTHINHEMSLNHLVLAFWPLQTDLVVCQFQVLTQRLKLKMTCRLIRANFRTKVDINFTVFPGIELKLQIVDAFFGLNLR